MIVSTTLFKKRNKNRYKFILTMSMYILLFVIRDVININVPTIIFTVYAVISFILFDENECVAFSVMLISLGAGVAVNYTLGAGLIIFLFKKRSYSLNKLAIPIILLLAYEFFHLFSPPFNLINYTKYLICILMMVVIIFDEKAKYDSIFIIKSYAYGVLSTVVIIFMQTLKYFQFSISTVLSAGLRFGSVKEFEQTNDVYLSNNQNAIALFCVTGIASLLVIFFTRQEKARSVVFPMSFLLIFGLLTASRTFIITISFILLFLLFVSFKDHKIHNFKYLFYMAFLGFFVFVIINIINPGTLDFIFGRFQEAETFGKRDTIFIDYLNYMFKDPIKCIFGIGMQQPTVKTGLHNSPHNSTLEAFVAWGVIGLVLIFTMLKNIVTMAKIKTNLYKIPLIYYLPFIVVLFFSQAGHLYVMNEFNLLFAFCYCTMLLSKKERVLC